MSRHHNVFNCGFDSSTLSDPVTCYRKSALQKTYDRHRASCCWSASSRIGQHIRSKHLPCGILVNFHKWHSFVLAGAFVHHPFNIVFSNKSNRLYFFFWENRNRNKTRPSYTSSSYLRRIHVYVRVQHWL